MGIDETIRVRCSKCRCKFRDNARRIRDGYSRQCPSCESMVFFLEGSPNKDASEALREAQRVRKALREEEVAKVSRRAAAPAAQTETDDVDTAPATSWRRVDRRQRSPGRA